VLSESEHPSQEWLAIHVRSSQYFLQIVKCSNAECCTPMRSALRSILTHGFFPAPLSVTNTNGLIVDNNSQTFLPLFQRLSIDMMPTGWNERDHIPYDLCCPSVTNYIANRTCNICQLYFPSNAMVTQHKRELHPKVKISSAPRCRPVRIAAKRQRELMAIIAAGMCHFVLNSVCYLFLSH
jgi:hypothetical protein